MCFELGVCVVLQVLQHFLYCFVAVLAHFGNGGRLERGRNAGESAGESELKSVWE